MTAREKRTYIFALCIATVLQMGGAAMGSALTELRTAFSQYPALSIQLISTLPSVFVALGNLLAGFLCTKYPKKFLIAFGCLLGVVYSLLGFFFHQQLFLLYVWAAILGIASSLSCTVASILVQEMFDDVERVAVLGKMAFACSIGTMCMTFAGGYLVKAGWYCGYLAYLIALPGCVLALALLPRKTCLVQPKPASGTTGTFSATGLLFPCAVGVLGSFLYSVSMTNTSMFVSENALGSSELAGTTLTLILLIAGIAGLTMAPLTKRIGSHCVTLGFLMMFAGYCIIYHARSYGVFLLGCLIGGGAITTIMPHVQILAAEASGEKNALGISIAKFACNIGTLFSPVLTTIAFRMFAAETVKYRYLLGSCIALLCAVGSFLVLQRRKRRTAENQLNEITSEEGQTL